MKNKLMKSIFALVLAFMALPMMGQDFMNIYFKNGDFRKFYMKNVTEIITSKFDADGIQHSDYDYQHITTVYDRYVYKLEEVDSITFTKIDEELAEHNFVSAMPTVFNAISDCESIDDVEDKIDQIKNAEGVEDVWSDGHQLYVAIAQDEVYSFHFDHASCIDDEAYAKTTSQIKAMLPRLANVVKEDGTKLKAVIANQQHKDKNPIREDYKTRYFTPLQNEFNKCGIHVDYVNEPTIDFFYDHCKDPDHAPHLNIYDYDLIFLITHGSYNNKLYYRWDTKGASYMNVKWHSIVTSEDIVIVDQSDQPYWENYYLTFRKWRDESAYKDATDAQINYSFIHEVRNGKVVWVAHPSLIEVFFRHFVPDDVKFSNPNSIFFNVSCQSLMGEDEDNPSFTLADEFIKRNLGTYIGYDESNNEGQEAGFHLFSNMLGGMSLKQAYNKLSEEERHNNMEDEDGRKYVANLLIYPDNTETDKLFLSQPNAEVITNEMATSDYNESQMIMLTGYATLMDYNVHLTDGIKVGFALTYHDPVAHTYHINTENVHLLDNNMVEFIVCLENLERNRQYIYCAYTYDGLNYNYGDTYSFEIEESTTPSYTSCPDNNHPHLIVLVLPSGTKWACCNVGASKPEEYGGYYAWGEIEEKDYYSFENYRFGYRTKTKYNETDRKRVLDPEDDVATVKFGLGWHTPSLDEMTELCNNCSWTSTTVNGINGNQVKGPNGNTIFMPAAGTRWEESLNVANSRLTYWTNELSRDFDYAHHYWSWDNSPNMSTASRAFGYSVRPVCK